MPRAVTGRPGPGAEGGAATLHVFPDIGSDGHRLVDRGDIWSPAMAEFLGRLGLSSR